MAEYHSIRELLEICECGNQKIWEAVMEQEAAESGLTEEQVFQKMERMYEAMRLADENYDAELRSGSGAAGGDGEKMRAYNASGKNLCSPYTSLAMEKALKMAESNACMKRIVAAPTAGACGVLPAVLVPYFQKRCRDTDKILKAMYVAAGIGQIIATRSSISGAAGGCQAEIGSASSMAAGALTYLQGGNCEQIATAAAMAMKNLLGLVCDPVAGLVEVPCVKRNVIGTVNAMACADMAMAGIVSRIPPDQVMDAMKEVGDKMDASLRETALGGLAQTEEGMKIAEKMHASYEN